jgi:hypothetical protein
MEQFSMNDPMGPSVFNVESSGIAISGTHLSPNPYTGYLQVGGSIAMATHQEEPVFTTAESYGTHDALKSYRHVPQMGSPNKIPVHYGVQKIPTIVVPESKVALPDHLHERQVQ